MVEAYNQQHPLDLGVLSQLGFIYHTAGKTELAWQVYEQIARTAPHEPEALFLRGALLMFEGRYEDARIQYEQLIQLQEKTPEPRAYTLASQACRQTGDDASAEAYARVAVKLDPSNIDALNNLCIVLLMSNPAKARSLMERALALAPHDPAVLSMKGVVLEFEGDKLGAWEAVRKAFEAGSLDMAGTTVAAEVAPAIGKMDEAIALLERFLMHQGISVGDQRMLHFKLTHLYDKNKQYDKAFEHARIANRMKNAWYDHSGHRVDLQRLKAVYSSTAIDSLPRSSNFSELPIFIVGMPRSGTSLLEQILSCHSQVFARGETPDIGLIVERISYYPDGVRFLATDKLDEIADTYLQRLHALAPHARRITDKMPGNYNFVGLISQLFPRARIINCRRDPRDVCLSQYMIEFGRGLTYSYDLEALANVCHDYQQLMTHWKAVLPIPILDVRYEELIADPQHQVARVLEFCGLGWEDACLNFHQSARQVVTASYDQVRKPLYKSSVARWKHYEQQLEPVIRILGLHGDTYP